MLEPKLTIIAESVYQNLARKTLCQYLLKYKQYGYAAMISELKSLDTFWNYSVSTLVYMRLTWRETVPWDKVITSSLHCTFYDLDDRQTLLA